MKAIISLILAIIIFLEPVLVPPGQAATVCEQQSGPVNQIYLPLVLKMAQVDALEQLENLLRQPAEFPFDGWITEVFPETVTMRLVGSNQIKRNIHIPSHISSDEIELGVPARLGEHRGQPILLAILPNLVGDINYAGKGSVFPDPPHIAVVALADGWHVTWPAVPGASGYIVYRNDTPDETSVDEVGETTQTSMVIPYESPFIYFAVRSVSGLNESELSGWLTDDTAPPVPDTFQALNAIDGHNLTIGGDDASLAGPGFKCWEIEQADDDSGTGAVSLGEFYPGDFPNLRVFGRGTIKYYRIRSVDWAGNVSDWTDWDDAWVLQGLIKDLFDGYGGDQISALESLWWLRIATLDSDEPWEPITSSTGTISDDTTYDKEGDGAKRITAELYLGTYYANIKLAKSIDLSNEGRFTNDDYVTITGYASFTGSPVARIDFFDNTSGGRFFGPTLYPTNGRNYIQIKKSEFTASGSPDWADISHLYLIFEGMSSASDYIVWDDFRIVKADPDDATTYNDTGTAWDRAANTGSDTGEWHIYEGNRTGEPSKPYSYGQIKTATTPSVWYLSHKPLSTTNIFSGTIQSGVYLKDSDGKAGLAFYVQDADADSWDMYVIEADSATDTITLAKYVGGTRTQIAQASFTFAPDQILWLGADFKDYQADGGRIKVYASLNEGNLIQAANLVMSEQDTEWVSDPGGSVGLLSYQANVRFVNFVAGSPAHAEVADVARALDGPIIYGEQDRLWLRDNGGLEKSIDGVNWAGLVEEASVNRPGVTRLYRRDADNGYSVQHSYDGSRWFLRGYNASDTFHAECRVGYSDLAAALVGGVDITEIVTGTLGSSASVITISSIPATYQALMLFLDLRTDRAASGDGMNFRFNNISSAQYHFQQFYAVGGTAGIGAWAVASQTELQLMTCEGNSATANAQGGGVLFIPNYTSSKRKNVVAISGRIGNEVAGNFASVFGTGRWSNTSIINRIDIRPNTGSNFMAGSYYALYGVG